MRSIACLLALVLAAVQLVTAAENVTQPPDCGVRKTSSDLRPALTKRTPRLTESDTVQMHRDIGLGIELLTPRHELYLHQCTAQQGDHSLCDGELHNLGTVA